MNQTTPTTTRSRLTISTPLFFGGAFLVSTLIAGCGGGSTVKLGSSAGESGDVVSHPDVTIGSETFIVEENRRGAASGLKVVGAYWGRLVTVESVESDGSHVQRSKDFMVGPDIRDGVTFNASTGELVLYELTRNPITDAFILTINAVGGSTAFNEALANLEANLTPLFPKGLEASETGPFSMVPRNAAIAVVFDDLLDPRFDSGEWLDNYNGDLISAASGQFNKDVVQLRTGYPPVSPFETRAFPDPNHGDLADFDNDSVPEFHSTRVLISATVSTIESELSDPPLPINAIGLPGSTSPSIANLAVRIPTTINPSVGQTMLLRNPTGHGLSIFGNGPTDEEFGTADVVRALRSGGDALLTSDANNGFLLDEVPPSIIGDLSVQLVGQPVVDSGDSSVFHIAQMSFPVPTCATPPQVGDVLAQGGVKCQVIDGGTQNGSTILNMEVRVIAPVGGVLLAGGGQLQTAYVDGQGNPLCFLRFSPNAVLPPNAGVATTAQVLIRFSEPMDPSTLLPFDSFTVTRTSQDFTPFDYVVGRVVPTPDLRAFAWDHSGMPLDHTLGTDETYYVNLASGTDGPTDLAGNALAATLPQSLFRVDPTQASEDNGGFAMRFHSPDEFFADDQFELRNGQMLYDPISERILPRPVSRFDVAADRNQPVPGVMTQFVGGVQTPLSSLGSKLQTVWRYCDVGFSLTDETNVNIDIEGLSWAPAGGSIVTDTYDEFGIILSHSNYLPDEVLDPNSGFPAFPGSGLKKVYENNRLDPVNDPGRWVHEKSLGYVVNPANLYTASSGTAMLPYPLNEDAAIEDYSYYTWRDTAITALGGQGGQGAMLGQEVLILGTGAVGVPYGGGQVPTVGMPILMEYRCYPADEALGLNSFDISLAANSSARPNFRSFSTGGYDNNNNPQYVDPDTETEANGGFNPTSNPPGTVTPGTDNSFYIGEMALVTRISRIHTIWFDTSITSPIYSEPLIEPGPDEQPLGTQVIFAYRGASSTGNQDPDDIRTNAQNLDVYGDPIPGAIGNPAYFGGSNWKSAISQINGARYFQTRITFVSNAATQQTAELRSLAFSYSNSN